MADTPLVAGHQSLLDGAEVVTPPAVQIGQTRVDRMGFFGGLAEGASNEWLVGNLFTGVRDSEYIPDPEWKNPVLEDASIPLGYRENFTRARNQEHYDAIKAQVSKEIAVHQRLQSADGWGVAGYMISSFVDPTLAAAIPVEELAIGAKALQIGKIARAIRSGVVYGTSNALTEAGLVANKETRDMGDVALAAGAGFAFPMGIHGMNAVLGKGDMVIRKQAFKLSNKLYDMQDGDLRPKRLTGEPTGRVYDTTEEGTGALKKSGPDDDTKKATFAGNKQLADEAARRQRRNIERGGPKGTELTMGERLRANRNGYVAAMADRLLEFSAGTGGKVVAHATADLRNSLHQKMIASTYADFDNLYKQWYKDMGYSMANARIGGAAREEFGKAILMELDARAMNINLGSHRIVKQVADEITPKYNKMSLDIQKRAGIKNADKVDHNPNYYARQWDYEKMFNLEQRLGKGTVKKLIARAVQGAYHNMSDADAKKIGNAFWRRFKDQYSQNSGANSHMWNADTRDTFQDYLMDILDEDTVQEIMNKITPTRGTGKAPGHMQRKLDLDMTATLDDGTSIYDLIEVDYGLLLSRQSRDVSGRAALAEIGIASDADWDEFIKLANKQKELNPALKKDTEQGIEQLQTARRALLGQSTIPNPNSKVARTARDLKDLTFLARMGQMGLAQLTELSNLLAENGLINVVKAIPQIRRMKKMVRDGTMPQELAEDMTALGWRVGDDHLMNIPHYRADEGSLKMSAYGDTPMTRRWRNGLQEGKRLMGYASLQNSIMRMEQKLWLHSTMSRFFEDATGGAPLRANRLADMGFDDEMMIAIRNNIRTHGGKFEDNGVITLGLDKWDADVIDAFRTGLMKQNMQAIQQNTIGDMPAWALNSVSGQMLTQFRTFPLVAWSKQLKRQVRHMDATTFGTVAYGVPICAAIHLAKTYLNAAGLSGSDRKRVLDAQLSIKGFALGILRYLPVASFMPDAAAAIAAFVGQDFSSPYRGGTARAAEMHIGTLAPGLGYASDAIKGISALTNPRRDMTPRDVRRQLGLIPFANILGVKNIINGISSAFGE